MEYVFAKQTCVVNWEGSAVRLLEGAAWPKSDPFVKAKPGLFDEAPTVVHRTTEAPRPIAKDKPVEAATAEPGKKRSTQ